MNLESVIVITQDGTFILGKGQVMTYIPVIEIPEAGDNAVAVVGGVITQRWPAELEGSFGFGRFGVTREDDGGITIDVWDSYKEHDLALLKELFEILCVECPDWEIILDWCGWEDVDPARYIPMKCAVGETVAVVFDPYADDHAA